MLRNCCYRGKEILHLQQRWYLGGRALYAVFLHNQTLGGRCVGVGTFPNR
jgi:hypothetical protein